MMMMMMMTLGGKVKYYTTSLPIFWSLQDKYSPEELDIAFLLLLLLKKATLLTSSF